MSPCAHGPRLYTVFVIISVMPDVLFMSAMLGFALIQVKILQSILSLCFQILLVLFAIKSWFGIMKNYFHLFLLFRFFHTLY